MKPTVTPAVLAIDAGSSRLRASLVALEDGAVFCSGALPTRSAGWELDVDALWRDLVELVNGLERRRAEIRAIAVAAQLGTVVSDERGRPVRPAILWGDARAVDEAEQLARALPPDAVRVTGRPITAELPVAKLRWLGEHERAALGRTRSLLSLKDAIVQRLTRRAVTDETHASYSGLFDVHARAWSPTLAEAAGVDPALLPAVAAGTDLAAGLDAGAGAELGLPAGMPVAVGGPDGTVGAVGAGAVRAGVTVDVAGTTDVLLHTVARPVSDPAGAAVLNAHVVRGLWTVGGPTGLTGGAVEWTARLLGFAALEDAYDRLGSAVELPAPDDGPIFVTSLAGSRFPTWRTRQSGCVAGLRPEHGPADLLRAALHGAAFTVGEGLEAIRALGLEVDEVRVVGGAAARTAGLRLRCDAWATPVVALAEREATTIGAAILGGVAAGAFPAADAAAAALVRPAARHEPRPGGVAALGAIRERWRAAGGAAR